MRQDATVSCCWLVYNKTYILCAVFFKKTPLFHNFHSIRTQTRHNNMFMFNIRQTVY